MKVLVTGATGFIGSHIAARLSTDQHRVTGLARSAARARRRNPAIDWIEGDFRRLADPRDWSGMLDGIDAVVNCAGVLQDGAVDRLTDVHVTGPDALFAACAEKGISRIVQISAAGAAPDATTQFMRTKAEGDRRLRERIPAATVLRPVLVVGRMAYGGTALIRALAAMPCLVLLPHLDTAIQTVDLDDVSETVSRIVEGGGTPGRVYAMAHPEPLDLAGIVAAYRAWLGFGDARTLRVPDAVIALACRAGDMLGYLGWRPPIRTTAIRQLAEGITADPADWMADFGIAPRRLADRLASEPCTVQDRWHARLFLLKPMLILALVLSWIASGLVALGPGSEKAAALLTGVGIPPRAAPAINAILSLTDIALGLAILWARWLKPAAGLMAAMCVAWLAGISALMPALWLDPLGPVLKIAGLLALALVVVVIVEDR